MDVKATFLNGELEEEVYMINLKDSHPQMNQRCASFRDPFMD